MKADPKFPPTRQHEILIAFARERGFKRGAEVGVLKGKTLAAVLDGVPGLHMIAVDQWRHLAPSDLDGAETYLRHDMEAAEASVRAIAARHPGRVKILKGDSVDQARHVVDWSLDFVFIDAAHTEAATLANIGAWSPKVRAGGLVMGHDWQWPSVRRALARSVGQWHEESEQVWWSLSLGPRQ